MIPPYFKQEQAYTCSLAVLRMVLASNNNDVTEEELTQKVEKEYGKKFKNILNTSIAELAKEYGLDTAIYKNLMEDEIKQFLEQGNLIQTSIRLHHVYPGKKGLHSVLLYRFENGMIYYHDPSQGNSQYCSFQQLIKAMINTGVKIVYK